MNIALIGASGFIGSYILKEALERGHKVTAIVRNPSRIDLQHAKLVKKEGDMLDQSTVVKLVSGQDAVISSYNPGWTNPNIAADTAAAYNAIIEGVKKSGVKRLLVVGGAGSLEISPGVQLVDSGAFPEAFKPAVLALREVLYTLQKEKALEWTFLSPSLDIKPGEKTGKFRLGKDSLLKDEKGESRISAADYAMAMIDELEHPKHTGMRFTVGY
jgi:uncharacterized protein